VVLSGGGLGLPLAVIPIALCDYSGHGVFVADKRLELLILGLVVGACGGALRVGWQARAAVVLLATGFTGEWVIPPRSATRSWQLVTTNNFLAPGCGR